MFELIGYAFLRALGLGWAWGRSYKPRCGEVFDNGDPILWGLGLVVIVAVLALYMAWHR